MHNSRMLEARGYWIAARTVRIGERLAIISHTLSNSCKCVTSHQVNLCATAISGGAQLHHSEFTTTMLLFALAVGVTVLHVASRRVNGPQDVNLWRLEQLNSRPRSGSLTLQDSVPFHILNSAEFSPQWFEQPLDHFDKSIKDTFGQRYWVNTRHYQPGVGGPVIVLDGGETSGEVRVCLSLYLAR